MLTSKTKILKYAVSILLCATCLSSPVMADNSPSSQPYSNWEIKQFVSEKNKFLPYCTLTRQYKDIILAIAKNDQGISNIAIESNSKLIKASDKSSIKITLETELISKTVSANPVTKFAVLIKLPKPNEIDLLMKDINTLTMTSNDFEKTLTFEMNNIGQAVEKLSLCLSQLKSKPNGDNDNLASAKDTAIQAELARKDAQIKEMQKSLNLQQKQIENAPLYKQAQQSTAFKNLNIANLDLELMRKQEDLERQAIGLTQQQEWIEKERLRVKKIHSADNQSEALKQAQLQIEKLENDYRNAEIRISELKEKQQKKPIEETINTTTPTNIAWNKNAINSDFTIPRHIPVSNSSHSTKAPITPAQKTHAPISLRPIMPEQRTKGIHVTSSKDSMPENAMREITQTKKPIEVETTFIISAPEQAPQTSPIDFGETIVISASKQALKPIKLRMPTQELARLQDGTVYIKPKETIVIKEKPIVLKRPESVTAPTPMLTPPKSNTLTKILEPEMGLSPIPFTNSSVMREETIATIPEPAVSQPYNTDNKYSKEAKEAKEDSKYDSFLENIMDAHRGNN